MAKFVTIPYSHLPVKPPMLTSIVAFMIVDLYKAPGWICGVVGCLVALLWLIFILAINNQVAKPINGYGERKDD